MRAHARLWGAIAGVAVTAIVIVSCGGTGGGGGHDGNPGAQFLLNSNNSGRLILNVNPKEVDANKSDRIGLVATLTDATGHPVVGVPILFTSDIDDITFVPGTTVNGRNVGTATTDAQGNADIIAVAGALPTGTGGIVGTGAIFAQPPPSFGLRAQASVTLLDVGFVNGDGTLAVIPPSASVTEPAPGSVIFFNVVGGQPPYTIINENSGLGVATLSQRCLPGCTENGGVLCIGSPCQTDSDCGAGSPTGTCIGPIRHCIASCEGTNCAGARCETDSDCNDGAASPAHVCQDSGQSIAFTLTGGGGCSQGCLAFTLEDANGTEVDVDITVTFICGNGVASGDEQCDLGDLREQSCQSLGFVGGGTLLCDQQCHFDTSNCQALAGSPSPGGGTPGGPTPTGVTPTPTPSATATPGGGGPTVTPTPGVGAPSNLALALLTNCAGDNGNDTATTVVAATVTDTNSNPVPDNTQVTFSLAAPSNGAVISSPSGTNTNAPCDTTAFAMACLSVVNQPGVAHTCITYPKAQGGTNRSVTGTSGAATDTQPITLPTVP